MIGVILAAGKGSRLKELSKDTPKSLLNLSDDKTILDYNLNILKSLNLDHILIVTGFAHRKIQEKISRESNLLIKPVYNPFWNHCNVLGSLYMALPYINDDFLFLHADTLVDQSVWEKLLEHEGDIVLPYKKKVCGEEEMKVVFNDKSDLIKITKEIDPKAAEGEFLGIAKFSSQVLDFVKSRSILQFSEGILNQYMESVVQEAIDSGQIDIRTFDIGNSNFVEVDFEIDLIEARRIFGT